MASLQSALAQLRKSLGIGGARRVLILPYRGCGTQRQVYLRGRVLIDKGIRPSQETDTRLRNFVNSYRRFGSDEVAGARVQVSFYGGSHEAVTDGEGFFEVEIRPASAPASDRSWHDVAINLVEPPSPDGTPVHVTGQVLIPAPGVRRGIISDIDDTVLQTNVADRLKMALDILLGNARTRLPFKGVAAFYRALHDGASGGEQNPLFCVSSSPWNLYDLLSEFFALHAIPTPVLFLRDWGLRLTRHRHHHTHKLAAIERIMAMYPQLAFILIGDSGQQDPEIYHEVVRAYPGRILAVYIRNVSRDPARSVAIRALAEQVIAAGSMLVLTDDTLAAAQHAAAEGWISPDRLAEVAVEKALDTTRAAASEQKPAGPTVVIESEASSRQ